MQNDPAKCGYVVMLVWTKVLQHMASEKFSGYADFYATCTSAANTVAGIAAHLASSTCSACKVSTTPDIASQMMAALRGHTRRLCEPEEKYFNQHEFQGAPFYTWDHLVVIEAMGQHWIPVCNFHSVLSMQHAEKILIPQSGSLLGI